MTMEERNVELKYLIIQNQVFVGHRNHLHNRKLVIMVEKIYNIFEIQN